MSSQQVLKWGNSLAVRIPSAMAKQMRVSAGNKVQIRLEDRKLIIEPAPEELPVFTQEDLLKALKRSKTRRDPLGAARGKELI